MVILLALPRAAWAGKIDDLAKQLASDDYRVRTQAALTLGATADVAATKPLCGALSDSNQTVRLAVVAALGKLGKDEGATCLKKAKGSEKDSSVKTAIDKAIEKIALGGDPPPPRSTAKYYVAIQVTNKTKRPNLEIEGLVRKAMQEKLLANSACAVAPRDEPNAQANAVLKKGKLKGYLLIASVEPFDYAGGNLKVQLKVTMWTYPDKSLKAEFSPWLKMQGASKNDTAGETELLKMTGSSAIDSFIKVANSL
ncbi:MAG: HEAT repeat domain-containing protein [Polyangiaceae bacterium]|nr:HEAT repeat domain-containing protein [Polyangiaceae bacterium]